MTRSRAFQLDWLRARAPSSREAYRSPGQTSCTRAGVPPTYRGYISVRRSRGSAPSSDGQPAPRGVVRLFVRSGMCLSASRTSDLHRAESATFAFLERADITLTLALRRDCAPARSRFRATRRPRGKSIEPTRSGERAARSSALATATCFRQLQAVGTGLARRAADGIDRAADVAGS